MARHDGRRHPQKRFMAAVIGTATTIMLAVGGVFAWLTASNTVGNTFETATATVALEENFTQHDEIKRDVHAVNTGNIDTWVRARIDMNWTDDDGTIIGNPPSCSDTKEGCLIDMGDPTPDGSWAQGEDGYWYWTRPVAPGSGTGNLIESLSLTDTTRVLDCHITVQSIQTDPFTAVEQAWSVTVGADGTITPKEA